jgi:hypothetical protein
MPVQPFFQPNAAPNLAEIVKHKSHTAPPSSTSRVTHFAQKIACPGFTQGREKKGYGRQCFPCVRQSGFGRKVSCTQPYFIGQALKITRYIKVAVLEEFLDTNAEEFGTERSIEVGPVF